VGFVCAASSVLSRTKIECEGPIPEAGVVKDTRIVSGLCACILLSVVSLGCGSGVSVPIVSGTSNPLVAQYNIGHIRPGMTAWVEFGTDTNYGRQTSAVTNPADGRDLSILVAGMKANTTYHMRSHVDEPAGSWLDQDHTFTTGALPLATATAAGTESPLQLPGISASAPVPGLAPAPGVELLSLTSLSNVNILQAIVTDLQGNIIWFYPYSASPIKLMPNGHFILNLGVSLREVDLTGTTIRDVSVAEVNQSLQANGYDFTIPSNQGVPGGGQFHHDILVLPNGDWLTLCQIAKSFDSLVGYSGTTSVVGDAVVDIDPYGDVVWAWSSFDHLDVNRHPYFGLPDWTHSNALVYTPDGNLLLSMRNQSWILKLDYANGVGTGDILWKLGDGGDFTLDAGDPSQWFYSQHYPNIVNTNGSLTTLAIFDNGNNRTYSDGSVCASSPTAPACYTRGTMFQIDESTRLATLLWQDVPGFYSFWGGSIGVLSNGDVEFASSDPFNGPSSPIIEVTQTNSPQIVWEMNITGVNAYRGTRIPSLYPGVTWQQ